MSIWQVGLLRRLWPWTMVEWMIVDAGTGLLAFSFDWNAVGIVPLAIWWLW